MGRQWISARAVPPALLALSGIASRATAAEPPPANIDPKWLLDPGALSPSDPEPGLVRLEGHGEYQVRLRGQRQISLPTYRANEGTADLSQTTRLTHWLRFTPQLTLGERLRIVGQADLARGFIGGQPTQYVSAARTPYDDRQPLQADPRWLYFDYDHGFVGVRGGQQPSHWGLGMVENDGNHRPYWGDYEAGTRVERLELRVHPDDDDPAFELRFAGDLVFADADADLRRDQHAVRAVASLRAGRAEGDSVGLLAIYRHQTEPSPVGEDANRAVVRRWTLDLTGNFSEPVAGSRAWVFGGFESALQVGDSTLAPTLEQTTSNQRESIAGMGATLHLGAVFTNDAAAPTRGQLVLELEWGWASGDADPYDGTDHRFEFDPSYNVGLLLFDEVLAWKTARAATIGEDELLGPRPRPESSQLASNGAVTGATYTHPQVIYRPLADLALQAGAVIAQTTSDFVNPVGLYTSGRYANYDGGSPTAHDLGVELLFGAEWHHRVDTGVTLQVGGQAATLFPGNAFADASGTRMRTLHAGIARIGVQY